MSGEFFIRDLEALRIKPDEVLIIRIPDGWPLEVPAKIIEHLQTVGLTDRALVFAGDIEFVVVEKDSL